MQTPVKTLTCGFSMPVYGLGTWEFGGKTERNPDNDDESDIKAIQSAIELGITHIDTAEIYANGYTEELVGKAIKEIDRSTLFLTSKVYSNNFRYEDVIRAAKASLVRLGTEYLDLYLLHRVNPSDIPVAETMRAMNTLVREGLVRHIGVSNHSVLQMEAAQKVSEVKIVANQLHYNLQIREVEKKGLLEYCQKNDVLLIAYRPVQKGMVITQGSEMLLEFGKKYHKSAAQIALNWLVSQQNVVTISKTKSIDHTKENLGALGWEMSSEDIEYLRREFPGQQFVSDVVPLS